jgi:glycosyltransferase involved in cell wall biosynthesis
MRFLGKVVGSMRAALGMVIQRSRRVSRPSLLGVLELPRIPESLSYRPHREQLGSTTLLAWAVERSGLCSAPVDRLVVLCHSLDELRFVRNALATSPVEVVESWYSIKLREMLRLARIYAASHLAWCTMEVGFGPTDLLSRMYSHHLAKANNCTFVVGLPQRVCPELYNVRLLFELARLDVAASPSEPLSVVKALLDLGRSVRVPMEIRAVPFDAQREYHTDPTKLPTDVALRFPRDLSVAKSVIAAGSTSSDTDPAALLATWKRAVLEAREGSAPWHLGAADPEKMGTASPRDSRARVLYVSTSSAFSGAQQSLCQLVSDVDASRYERVALVALEGHLTERLRRAGAEVICPQWDLLGDNIGTFRYVSRLLKEQRPDVIHANGIPGDAITLAAVESGVRLIQHVRVSDLRGYETSLQVADAVVAVSDFVRGEILRLEVPTERVAVVRNGVDLDEFRPWAIDAEEARGFLGIPPEAKVVLVIARYSPRKRYDLVFRAAGRIKRRVPSLFLLIVGEVYGMSPEYDAVREAAAMSSWVRLLGFRSDVRAVFAASDLLISCAEREPLARCVLEAMAMAVPVIVGDSGGTKEIVIDGSTGFVVPITDAGPLADRAIRVLSDGDLSRGLGRRARQYAELNLDSKTHARHIMRLYDHVLKSPRRL